MRVSRRWVLLLAAALFAALAAYELARARPRRAWTSGEDSDESGGDEVPVSLEAPPPPPEGLGRPPQGAIVANRLSDFRTVDDSKVWPRGAGPEIVNITEIGPRTFNFVLRHRGSWHDGDRDKNDPKKSRAEVSSLGGKKGPGMRVGETWDIATTVRLDPGFVPSRGYCNIMQPVFDQSYLSLGKTRGDEVTAQLMAFTNGIGSQARLVRQFTITRGRWTPIVVRVKFAANGSYACSVNGDAFQGINLNTTRGSQPFHPKWGLYGPSGNDVNNRPLRDQIVQHANIYCARVNRA